MSEAEQQIVDQTGGGPWEKSPVPSPLLINPSSELNACSKDG